jgi:hypothetical protein
MAYDVITAERVRDALSDRKGVIEKGLMGGLCFMVGGAMCCTVSGRGGLLVRVDPNARERMLAEPHVSPMVMRGRTAKGFVRVAAEGYRTAPSLKKWIARGVAAAAAAKVGAKPKKKAAKKKKL